ncbi:hypothetical protein NDU88_002550 [Pleurodeles waltl]|uniref:Uncharacterized protein n=1 Tax=Pleurodeles waltl TaxID=8319 RepID=A0AAV7MP84_PLEWA|nr:hypothetical protein NDU88_002550 [Pleurodeles waltl]
MACSRLSANTATEFSDWRCSRSSEECVYRSHDSMGAGPDALSPDFRVPDRVKRDNGLRGRGEEESLDATERNKKTEEPKDAASQNGGGATGNSELPSTKSGPAERTNRKETSIHRHVPGWAWLNKVQSLFKGQYRSTEARDGGEERENGGGSG